MTLKRQDPVNQIQWLECQNVFGADIPAFAAMKVVGMDATRKILLVTQPDDKNQNVVLNADKVIKAGGYGACTRDPWWGLYTLNGSAPGPGDSLGSVAGDFGLLTGNVGFICDGGAFAQRALMHKAKSKGFTGAKFVCEGDGTLHQWVIVDGQIMTA